VTIWERRDLPVLRALATSDDTYVSEGYVMLGHGRGQQLLKLELKDGEIHDAILTLGDAGYVQYEVGYTTGPGATFTHVAVTGRGQQALGEWPLFDTIASPETLALMLERLADEAPTDEEAANMRRAAGYVRTLSGAAVRAFATGAIAAIVRGALGLG
jgi:hypothetical protein